MPWFIENTYRDFSEIEQNSDTILLRGQIATTSKRNSEQTWKQILNPLVFSKLKRVQLKQMVIKKRSWKPNVVLTLRINPHWKQHDRRIKQ